MRKREPMADCSAKDGTDAFIDLNFLNDSTFCPVPSACNIACLVIDVFRSFR